MTKKVVKKKRRRKVIAPVARLALIGVILFSAYLLFISGSEIFTMFKLNGQIKDVEAELQEVKDQNAYLTRQRNKLEDPDYIQAYSREHYLLTVGSDRLYYLPSNNR